jgi:energy-coupling factor transporter ATP-binding protein EcfA2
MPIDAVSVRGVRGIRETVHFYLNGQSLLVHGDNGTGKSSLERALRWALLGQEEPTSDAAHSTAESYRRHVEVAPDFPEVKVVFTDDSSIEVRHGAISTTGRGAQLRDAFKRASPFLRRSELLDVLSSRPVDRFQYFESFLGLERIDTLLSDLGSRRNSATARRDSLATRFENSLGPIVALLPPGHGRPASVRELDAAARAWANALRLSTASEPIDQIAKSVADIVAAAASGDTDRRRARIEQAIDDVRSVSERLDQQMAAELDSLVREKADLEQQAAEPSVSKLLEHAVYHFRRSHGTVCPVCGQAVNWNTATAALEARVEALSRYRAVLGAVRNGTTTLHALVADLQRATSRLAEGAPEAALQNSDVARVAAIPAAEGERAMHAVLAIGPTSLTRSFEGELNRVDQLARRLLLSLPDPSEVPSLQSANAFFERLTRDLPQLQLLESEAASLTREVDIYEKVVTAIRHSRQDVAKETLAAIQALVEQYYFAIHPRGSDDDATGAPSIDVQRHGKGSAFVRGEFHGRQVKDPTWAYSDGHLDTVAICIFLALRTFRAGQPDDPKLMVLDDVVLSIDLGHARRFITLLREEFAKHQIIILTHNGLFAHWCRNLLPNLRRVQIKAWSLARGPSLGDHPTAREQVNAALESGTPKEIAVRLMELLDEWTADARYAFSVAVPAKPGDQYTLTDIWEPLAKALKGLGKSLGSDLGGAVGALDVLRDLPAIRNLLAAHENDFAKEFPRATMVEIGRAACTLVDALYCAQCRAFVQPSPGRSNASIMHCPDHHVQYVKAPAKSRIPSADAL